MADFSQRLCPQRSRRSSCPQKRGVLAAVIVIVTAAMVLAGFASRGRNGGVRRQVEGVEGGIGAGEKTTSWRRK